ncbi:MAG: alpha/beta fold hydrolase [Deltaproteobacteria bacterium]|nr:alpha/beta fold hydrolase [Deltaproteobacteria bacterium]
MLATDVEATYEGAADLIGASLGAAVALELALTCPERVRSLTLITPFALATPRLFAVADGWRRVAAEARPETLAAMLLPWFFSSAYLADEATRGRTLLPWFFSSAYLADEATRGRTLRGLAQTVARVPATTLDRMTRGLSAWSGTRADDLGKVSVPTLVIVAGEDLLAPDGAAIARSIPDATTLVIEGAGHAVALEAPDAVNEAITQHLQMRA